MGICQKYGNGDGRESELNRWEWKGMGMLKAIPAHLYFSPAAALTMWPSILSVFVQPPCFSQMMPGKVKFSNSQEPLSIFTSRTRLLVYEGFDVRS